MSANLVL